MTLLARRASILWVAASVLFLVPAAYQVVQASPPTRHAEAMIAHITIQNFAFSPTVLTVTPGTTVIWTQKDTVGHTVTSDSSAWQQSAVLTLNDTFKVTFTRGGIYKYHCSPHPFMTGTIVVNSGTGANSPTPAATHDGSMISMGPISRTNLMAWTGYFDGKMMRYISTDTSSKTEAMRDRLNYAPALLKVLSTTSVVYFITNGAFAAHGPVFGSAPGEPNYSPLSQEVLVTWTDPLHAMALTRDDQIKTLARAGKPTLKMTRIVRNCPTIPAQAMSGM